MTKFKFWTGSILVVTAAVFFLGHWLDARGSKNPPHPARVEFAPPADAEIHSPEEALIARLRSDRTILDLPREAFKDLRATHNWPLIAVKSLDGQVPVIDFWLLRGDGLYYHYKSEPPQPDFGLNYTAKWINVAPGVWDILPVYDHRWQFLQIMAMVSAGVDLGVIALAVWAWMRQRKKRLTPLLA